MRSPDILLWEVSRNIIKGDAIKKEDRSKKQVNEQKAPSAKACLEVENASESKCDCQGNLLIPPQPTTIVKIVNSSGLALKTIKSAHVFFLSYKIKGGCLLP